MRTLIGSFVMHGHSVQNSGPREYAYLYVGNREVQIGDYALVHNGSSFGMIQINRIKPGIEDKVTKHVIAVVTQADFNQYEAMNKGISEYRKVFDELDFAIAEDKRFSKYKDLAERDPKVAELLKKAREWQGPVLDIPTLEQTPVESTMPLQDIPSDVLWDPIQYTFRNKLSGAAMSPVFFKTWYERHDEFPVMTDAEAKN